MKARHLAFTSTFLFALLACDGLRPSGPTSVEMQSAVPLPDAVRDGSSASPLDKQGLRPGSVVFYSARGGLTKIYALNPKAANPDADAVQLTTGSGAELWPDVSPDGRYVALASNSSGHNEIYVLDLRDKTKTLRNVSNISGATDSNWPRWSPDGRRIAFHSNRDGNYHIFTVKADGTDLRRITTYATSAAALDQFPDWSPNGRQLVFRRGEPPGNPGDIYVADADGEERNVRALTTNPALDQMAAWSPNGRQIAFMSTRDGYPSVFVMTPAGDTPEHAAVNLTPRDQSSANSDWASRAPAWSKDGEQIYFSSFRPSTGGAGSAFFELFVMKANGKKVRRLTMVAGEDGGPRSALMRRERGDHDSDNKQRDHDSDSHR
ncbi:MAG: TolB family protein [Gemmatimonadaceae bacterium]